MTDRRPSYQPDDLEQTLARVGESVDWPQSRDLTTAVRARIAQERQPLTRRWGGSYFARLALAAAACIVIVIIAALAVPDARTTIADRLGLPGISISSDDTDVADSAALDLGERRDLPAAFDSISYPAWAPPAALGDPDEVYLLQLPQGEQVSYVYRASDNAPGGDGSGVEVLISQFPGNTNESFIGKQLSDGTTIELTTVGQDTGFWIAGEPHVFYYEDPAGEIREESIRLAVNVLIWERDGVTLRIESNLTRDEAIRIAESMTPQR